MIPLVAMSSRWTTDWSTVSMLPSSNVDVEVDVEDDIDEKDAGWIVS